MRVSRPNAPASARPTIARLVAIVVIAAAPAALGCAPPLTEEGRAQLAEEIHDKPLMRAIFSDAARINEFAKPTETPHTRRLQATEIYRSLDYLRREVGEQAVDERLARIELNYRNLEAMALWLRDQYVYTTSPSPHDGLRYFDALVLLHDAQGAPPEHRLHVGGMAAGVWVSSQLLALEDHARCEDRTGGIVYFQNWERHRREAVERIWQGLDEDMRASALRMAQLHTKQAITRPPDPRPCASGIKAMNAAMKADRCRKTAPPPNADEYVGRSVADYIHCEGADFVRYVDDETWRTRLEALHEEYWDRLFAPESTATPATDVASPPPR